MAALYFREPTEEEKQESGIKEPFTVLDRIEDEPEKPEEPEEPEETEETEEAEEVKTDPKVKQQAWNDMFKDSAYYLDKIMKGQWW